MRDTKLDRDVAIKVLPAEFTSDEARLARFEPESYARIRRDGVSFSATVDATAPVRHVKAVVYDYPADGLGTAVTQLK